MQWQVVRIQMAGDSDVVRFSVSTMVAYNVNTQGEFVRNIGMSLCCN